MVDGGTSTATTSTPSAWTPSATIEYRSNTTKLTSSAKFYDNYTGLINSCGELYSGTNSPYMHQCQERPQRSGHVRTDLRYRRRTKDPVVLSCSDQRDLPFVRKGSSSMCQFVSKPLAGPQPERSVRR